MINLAIFFTLALLSIISNVQAANVPVTADVVRREAVRSQLDPGGRPLPLVASWERKLFPLTKQVEMIEKGIPLLPWIDWGGRTLTPDSTNWMSDADQLALKTLKEWNIPVSLLYGGQWEQDFYSTEYINLPIDQTGVGMNLDGTKMSKVSPFSPIEPWLELGRKWGNSDFMRLVQTLYPNPPLVLLISNNEAAKLKYQDAEQEKRYLDEYGSGKDVEFRQKIFGDRWIERYSALIQGIREGMSEPAWQNNSRIIGYNAFGPVGFGRYWGWENYSLTTEDRITPWWYAWEGGVVNAYDNNWETAKAAYQLWSMQSETMNLVFMQDEARKVKPEYWFELIFWDGYSSDPENSKYSIYTKNGIEYSPDLYRGWTQYDLWLAVPRLAREFRYFAAEPLSRFEPYFNEIISSVQFVHSNPVLTRFWRKGDLVINDARPHPFTEAIPQKWTETKRWYCLDTNLDNSYLPYPNKLYTEWPVWTLARVIGTAPEREWLIYGFAPKGSRSSVEVTIPDYKKVTLPSLSVGGDFYYIKETTNELKHLQENSSQPIESPALELKP